MQCIRRLVLGALALSVTPLGALAQVVPEPPIGPVQVVSRFAPSESATLPVPSVPRDPESPSDIEARGVSASGMFLSAIGLLGGAAVGAGIATARCDGDADCVRSGLFLGANVGGTLLGPVGVHLASSRPGSYPLAALASAGVGLVGYGALSLVPGRPTGLAPFITTPLQVLAATAVERRTYRPPAAP